MSDTTTDWAAIGHTVYVLHMVRNMRKPTRIEETTVVKHTKTQVVTATGARFRRLKPLGESMLRGTERADATYYTLLVSPSGLHALNL